MRKKIDYTPEELANDPSLCFCPYRRAEMVHSDTHACSMRFMRYEGELVVLATMNAITEVSERVSRLSIRRVS